MDYEEEQRNELEALQEIYYDEIEVLSRESPISLTIKVRSQSSEFQDSFSSKDDDDTGDEEEDEEAYDDSDDGDETLDESAHDKPLPMAVTLKFELPLKYPDEKPSIELLSSRNLDDYDLKGLLSNLQDKAEESLGYVMIFQLINEATEWLLTKTTRMEEEIQEEKDRKARADEEEQVKRLDGTKVTAASFLAWKAKFDAELLVSKMEKSKLHGLDEGQLSTGAGGQRRLTGREMFETDKSLIESDLNFDDLDQNQIESLLQVDDDGEELDPSQFDDLSDDDDDGGDEDDDDEDDDDDDDDFCDDNDEDSAKIDKEKVSKKKK